MVGRVHGIDALINNSPTQIGVHISPLSMAGTVEAILGAVYLDSGMKAVSQVMLKLGLMPKLIRKTLPKSVLQTQPSTPATETPAADSSTVGHEKSPPPEPLQQL